MITCNAPNCYTSAPTGYDTLGYSDHVMRYRRARYAAIEPQGYLLGAHDHVAHYYSRKSRSICN